MNNEPVKLISPERVARLIECYGANSDKWPASERVAAVALLQRSTELQDLQRQTKLLDDILSGNSPREKYITSNEALVSRIVSRLPAQHPVPLSEKPSTHQDQAVTEIKHPSGINRLWSRNNMIAASVAVFCITALMIQLQLSAPDTFVSATTPTSDLTQAELERWMWEEVTGDAPQNNNDESLTFMAMIELE